MLDAFRNWTIYAANCSFNLSVVIAKADNLPSKLVNYVRMQVATERLQDAFFETNIRIRRPVWVFD
jgi:hypothetical protein